MKKFFTLIGLLISTISFAQNVGIGTTTPTEQLHTTGSVRFQNLSGNGNRLLIVDSTGKLKTIEKKEFTNNTISGIPDNGCTTGSGATSTIVITNNTVAVSSSNISVTVNITHEYADYDLNLYLISPTGEILNLLSSTGQNTGSNLTNTTFSDDGKNILTGIAPYTGNFKPFGQPLSTCLTGNFVTNFAALNGGSIVPNGTWTLKVFDSFSGDDGTLNNWSISFSEESGTKGFLPKFSREGLVNSKIYEDSLNHNIGIGTYSPTSALHTKGDVRLEGYAGTGKRILMVDDIGKLVVGTAASTSFSSTNNTLSIPDNGCSVQNGANSSINVTGLSSGISSSKITVKVNLTHPFDGDVAIYLVSNTGEILRLVHGVGGNGDNFENCIFSDEASLSISGGTAPFTGSYRPGLSTYPSCLPGTILSKFSEFGGGNVIPNGTWTLRVFDKAETDAGTLNNWSISFEGLQGAESAGTNNFLGKINDGSLLPSKLYQNPITQNIGIGTLSPSATLDINGTVKISGGSPAVGKVLMSDANGNATWNAVANPSLNTGVAVNLSGNTVIQSSSLSSTQTVPFVDNIIAYRSFDDGNNFDNTTNTYTAPASGVYAVSFNISNYELAASQNNGILQITLSVQGSSITSWIGNSHSIGSYLPNSITGSTLIKLNQGNTLKLLIAQSTGVPVYLDQAGTNLSIYRIY